LSYLFNGIVRRHLSRESRIGCAPHRLSRDLGGTSDKSIAHVDTISFPQTEEIIPVGGVIKIGKHEIIADAPVYSGDPVPDRCPSCTALLWEQAIESRVLWFVHRNQYWMRCSTACRSYVCSGEEKNFYVWGKEEKLSSRMFRDGILRDRERLLCKSLHGEHVYFILSKECERVKIGRSSRLYQRLGSLRGDSPTPLFLVFSFMEGMRGWTEKKIHKELVVHRSHGEWFESNAAFEWLLDTFPEFQCAVMSKMSGLRI